MNKPPFPEVIDNSMMKDWNACERKCELKDFRHWKRQGESEHLHAGACFARGLEKARHGFFSEGKEPDAAIAEGFNAMMIAWGDFVPPEGSAKTLDRMLGALEFYFDEWKLAESAPPTKMPSGKYAIEFNFAEPLDYLHPVTGNPIIYTGRTDMLCDFADGIYIEDDKTATQLGDSWVRSWELQSQFTGYAWAAAKAKIDIKGIIVRGVSILKTKYGRAEAITYRSKWEIDRWYEGLHRKLARMQAAWESGIWELDLSESCSAYGGCEFQRVCKSPDPELWLPMYFERRRWDPMERTETLLTEPE